MKNIFGLLVLVGAFLVFPKNGDFNGLVSQGVEHLEQLKAQAGVYEYIEQADEAIASFEEKKENISRSVEQVSEGAEEFESSLKKLREALSELRGSSEKVFGGMKNIHGEVGSLASASN